MNKTSIATVLVFGVVILAVVCIRSGCGAGLGFTGGYSFQDTAIYIAPNSKLEVTVTSSGYVPDGSDIGEGKGFVKLYSTENNIDTMFLKTSVESIDSITYKGKTIPFSCDQLKKNTLYDYLVSVGYKHLDKNEITEIRDAMTSINMGRKGGLYPGQTKYIIVSKH